MNAGQIPQVALVIKNFGQTPAYKVTHWIAVGLDSYPNPTINPIAQHPDASIPLAPGGFTVIRQSGLLLTAADAAQIRGGTMAIYAVGEIRYVNAFKIFKKNRFTSFRLFSGATVGKPGEMATHQKGNDAN
jgi:hypothetical protein